MPPADGVIVSDEDKEKIMHISLPISSETILMGSDSSEAFGHGSIQGNNYSISINTDSVEEATRLFNGLSKDGIIKMPLEKTFWGAYFGMFIDKFGIHWMVNHDIEEKNH
jgi:PhnB protein